MGALAGGVVTGEPLTDREEETWVACPGCGGAGQWFSECCDGSRGCSCRGEIVPMGSCHVCHGMGSVVEGQHDPAANVVPYGDFLVLLKERSRLDQALGRAEAREAALSASLVAAQEALRQSELRRAEALVLLQRLEHLRYGATTELDDDKHNSMTCPVCTWPKGGHPGPGRYKGNAENKHEQGCSMYAVLHGQPAPRIARQVGALLGVSAEPLKDTDGATAKLSPVAEEGPTLLGILGRERALINGLTKVLHNAVRRHHNYAPIRETRRGADFLVDILDGPESSGRVARVTVELEPLQGEATS